MSIHILKKTQVVNCSLEAAWDFFSSPTNLQIITPDHMRFEITSQDVKSKMYAGMIISYLVRPLLNIPLKWVTEITQVKEGAFFVDEQRFGPYKFWHHKHFFEEIPEGVLMTDLIHYSIPLGPIGDLMNKLFVRKQLEDIFSYRTKKIEELFPNYQLSLS